MKERRRLKGSRSSYRRGINGELVTIDHLEQDGWICFLARRSRGHADVIAMRGRGAQWGGRGKPWTEIWLVQVKCTSRPYERFQPAERRALIERADQLPGAVAVLAHLPAGAEAPRFIPDAEWPI